MGFNNFIKGDSNCILSSAIMVAATAIFFACSFIYSLKKYANLNFTQALWQAIITSIYFLTIWFPIAMFIIFKIIFTQKNMDWGKTQHGVATVVIEGIE